MLVNKDTIYGDRFFDAEPGGGTPVVETKSTDLNPSNGKDLPADVKERMEYLEKENKELINQRDKAKDKIRKEEEAKLLEDKKFQELIATKEREIESLKPDADAYKAFRESEMAEAKKALKDKWDDEYSKLSLPALRNMVNILSAKKPDPGGGDGGPSGNRIEMTLNKEEEKRALEMFPGWDRDKALDAFKELKAKKQTKK